jgi:dUTP pyrophosphatase
MIYQEIYLTLYVSDDELFSLYTQKAKEKNAAISEKCTTAKGEYMEYIDSGFDIFVPRTYTVNKGDVLKLSSEIVCDMRNGTGETLGFYVYPRSSISKTPLRLANSVGIIDSGYRGPLIGMFDHIGARNNNEPYVVEKHSRLLQICSPILLPFKVDVIKVDDLTTLSQQTKRGSGGFGSTGI